MSRGGQLVGPVFLASVVACGGGGAKPDGAAGMTGSAAGASGAAGTSAPIEPASDAQIPAADGPSANEVGGACTPCTDYAAPVETGRVMTAALNQLSGIAVSHKNPGVLF